MPEKGITGKIYMEKDFTRKVYFEGYDEPLVSLSNPDLTKLGLPTNTKVPHSFHIVAGVLGSWMTSTLHSALSARGIETIGELVTDIKGDYAFQPRDPSIPGLLNKYPMRLLDTLHLNFNFNVPPGKREEAEKAMDALEERCAVYQTIQRGIKVKKTWNIKEKAK